MAKTMTLEDLNRGLQLEKQITEQEEILASLRAKAYPGAQQLDGMPHSGGISDRTGYYAIAIADLEADIKKLRGEQEQALKEIDTFIRTVEDKRIRCIMRLRFLCFLYWKEVADAMGPYYNSGQLRTTMSYWLKKQASSCSP